MHRTHRIHTCTLNVLCYRDRDRDCGRFRYPHRYRDYYTTRYTNRDRDIYHYCVREREIML